MYKVAVVGDKDSVMGFLALGIDISLLMRQTKSKKPYISWWKKDMPLYI